MATSSGRSARRSKSIGLSGWPGASVPQPFAVVGPPIVLAWGSAVVAMSFLLSSSFQYAPGLHKMRAIDHFAADGQHARVGMCLERGDNRFGVADFVRRRRESEIDDRHLRRMDRELAGEALAPGGFGFGAKAVFVFEVGENTVDRLDSGCDCAGEAK